MRWLLIRLVRFYQIVISPFLPPSCRFEPSCSNYAIEAIQTHGALKGSWMALQRIGRCNPFCEGGYDPVPEAKSASGISSPRRCHDHPVNYGPTDTDKEPTPVSSVDQALSDAHESVHPDHGKPGHNVTNPPN